MDPSQKFYRASRLKRAFNKPSVDIHMASDYFDSFESVEDEDIKESRVHGDSTFTVSSAQCMVCFDDFQRNEVGLSACGHEVCTSCWR